MRFPSREGMAVSEISNASAPNDSLALRRDFHVGATVQLAAKARYASESEKAS